jgi:hypothetical protein
MPHPPGGFPPLPYGHYAFPTLPPQVVQQPSQPQPPQQAPQQAPQQPQTANNAEGDGSAPPVRTIEEEKKFVDPATEKRSTVKVEKKNRKKSKGKTGEENVAVDS